MKKIQTQRCLRALWLCIISAAALLLCSKTSPLYAFQDWADANIFYTMGKSLFNGLVLYRDVFDHKGPVLYLLYGLGYLLDRTGFGGVFVIQIAAFALLLAFGLRTAELILQKPLHPAWAAVPAALITASRAYSHGGSAEELLLPFLAAALYAALRAAVQKEPLPLRTVFWQGLLAGCALWLKYTVLGFYLAWVTLLAIVYARRGQYKRLWKSGGAYLLGMAAATLPWVVYFGLNGALKDWFTVYFYDNLFLYNGMGGGAVAWLRKLWWALRDDTPAAVWVVLFLLWALGTHRRKIALCTAVLGAGLAATTFMGGYLVYYGLVLAVFAPLGIAPLAALALHLKKTRLPKMPRAAVRALPWAAGALCIVYCFAFSANKAQRFRKANTLPQLRFAQTILADENATLLNYGTLDGGFYTAAGLLPPCRYFCITNMPLTEQNRQQAELMNAGTITYVVASVSDIDLQFPCYEKIDQCTFDGGEGIVTWYLYRLRGE